MMEPLSVRELRDANRAIVDRLRVDHLDEESVLEEAKRLGDSLLLGESYATESVRAYILGDVETAVVNNERARQLLDEHRQDGDPFFLWLVETTSGLTMESQGEVGKALTYFAAAADIGRSARLIDLTARSLMSLGFIANRQSDPVRALGFFLELLHLPDLGDSTTAATYNYLAVLFEDQRQWDLALLYLSEGLARASNLAPDVEGAMRGLYAGLLARTGRFSEAKEALELAGRVTVSGTIYAAQLDESRGRCLYETGDLDQAEKYARQAFSLLTRQGAPSHLGKPAVLLSQILLDTGRAAEVLECMVNFDHSMLPVPQAKDLLLLRLRAHRALGQFEEAAKCHDYFVKLVDQSKLDTHTFYRLHQQLVDAHSLEAQHTTLISRQIELTRLQDELVELMDQVANDLNSPLTTLQLIFDGLSQNQDAATVAKRLPNAWRALERMSQLAELFSAVQEEDEAEPVESARV